MPWGTSKDEFGTVKYGDIETSVRREKVGVKRNGESDQLRSSRKFT